MISEVTNLGATKGKDLTPDPSPKQERGDYAGLRDCVFGS